MTGDRQVSDFTLLRVRRSFPVSVTKHKQWPDVAWNSGEGEQSWLQGGLTQKQAFKEHSQIQFPIEP